MLAAIPVIFLFLLLLVAASRARAKLRDPLSGGRALALGFIDLGNMTGKTADEIIAAVGAPSARSAVAGGMLLQWQAPGYHMALSFDADGTFRKITHESHQFNK